MEHMKLTARAKTTRRPIDPGFGNKASLLVNIHWTAEGVNLDRPCTLGFGLPDTKHGRSLAARLTKAIDAQAVVLNPSITTDSGGKTYVAGNIQVMCRYMNADLKRLGF